MAKITFRDIAKAAGVGTATVERVLNARGGVQPQTVEKVIAAARRLDYPRRLPAKHRGILRIEILMVRPELSFIARLSRAFERISANLDRAIAVHRTIMDEGNPEAVAARILGPGSHRSALIVALPNHPAISAALHKVRAAGLPVVQLMTPMQGLDTPFVGIDNEAAGRMAGLLMAGLQQRPGKVVALCHSQIYGVHRARMRGFSDFKAKTKAAHLDFRYIGFTRDDDHEAARVLAGVLAATPDIVGVYSAGGDYGALCDLLRKTRQPTPICFIGHELTEQSAAALREGTMAAVIDQAPETQARRAIDTALHQLGLLRTEVDASPIRFVTVTAENL
ncbi:MAG: LacI family DNA-binding transcriptional regulator [Hyphomicrobiales bacterium]